MPVASILILTEKLSPIGSAVSDILKLNADRHHYTLYYKWSYLKAGIIPFGFISKSPVSSSSNSNSDPLDNNLNLCLCLLLSFKKCDSVILKFCQAVWLYVFVVIGIPINRCVVRRSVIVLSLCFYFLFLVSVEIYLVLLFYQVS